MNIADLIKAQNLHHAYLVVGDAEKGKDETLAMLESRGVPPRGNPDVRTLSFGELLVDDVRDTVLPFAALKPLGDRKYVIISFSRANDAAQNALLKAVEESLGKTVFFFSVDVPGHMLSTLRSRCIVVSCLTNRHRMSAFDEEAEEFLKASYAERLASVEKMVDYIAKTQDRAPAREFVKALLRACRGDVLGSAPKTSPQALRDILDATQHLRMQGSSAKSVLAHLAVMLPCS